MSTEQHDVDAYGQELARISHHQSEATAARFTVFQALAAAGITNEQADDIVSKLEAGAVASAHTWISESSPPHGSEQRFEDGWFAGVRDVASYLLRIADTTATGPGPAPRLYVRRVLAVAERFAWAVAAPGDRHWPGGEFLDVALSAPRTDPSDRPSHWPR